MRPEMAAWRYGDQFGRRRRNMYIRVGAGIAAIGAIYGGAAAWWRDAGWLSGE
jgi:hypothetical protein